MPAFDLSLFYKHGDTRGDGGARGRPIALPGIRPAGAEAAYGGSAAMIRIQCCKGNYVRSVREIMCTYRTDRTPKPVSLCVSVRSSGISKRCDGEKQLDKSAVMYIIIFTDRSHVSPKSSRPRQTQCLAPNQHSAPASAAGYRPAIPGPTLLRCPRPDAGQVRVAAQGGGRWRAGQLSGNGFRVVAPLFLPGALCLRRGRVGRLGTAEARTTAGPQVERRGVGVPRTASSRATGHPLRSDGRAGARAVWHRRESAQYRAPSAARAKKNELTLATPPSSGGSSWKSRYEDLRRQVLAGNSHGPGLAVLLGRGMRAWLDVAGSLDVRPTPPRPEIAADAGPLQTVPGECRVQLTALLAGIILHGWQQGRHA